MEERFKIIIIEHEDNVRQALVAVFEHHHFDVEATGNAELGYEKARSGEFDLLLLDARMDDRTAFDICTGVRARDPAQVIFMLTANGDDSDLIKGLADGADDYICVPFAYTDLVQRSKALLRRSRLQSKTPSTTQISLGDKIEIDCASLSGQCVRGQLEFTPREMRVLEYLYKHRGKTVDAHELLNQVWGYPRYLNTETRTVAIHIATLVNKIEGDPENPQFLKQVGDGAYQLSLE
ncbi:MAG: response regulator transcription factor [Gammaproteobacteria bacterium]|nr:response regulator transcription factor [Gammaproteobacteria bacterium]MBQ0840594.1 response regulator transcription factor [Gammaproteobacteria bacterium]